MSFLFTTGVSVGASTAIFGLIGAELVFLIQNRRLFSRVNSEARSAT
jgi:membrane associated rhomboid family serine protease